MDAVERQSAAHLSAPFDAKVEARGKVKAIEALEIICRMIAPAWDDSMHYLILDRQGVAIDTEYRFGKRIHWSLPTP